MTSIVKAHHLKKHSQSTYHQTAAVRGATNACAPSEHDFRQVLEHFTQHGTAGLSGLSQVGGAKKIRRMSICLAEAMFQRDREFVETATSLTLLRDARKGVIAVRFVAVDASLQTHAGLLGAVSHLSRFGSGGLGLVKSTYHVMKQFSSVCVPLPPVLNRPALDVLQQRCHMVTVDSAADEIVASEIMRQPLSVLFGSLTPNCQIVMRDKAHASRRPARWLAPRHSSKPNFNNIATDFV